MCSYTPRNDTCSKICQISFFFLPFSPHPLTHSFKQPASQNMKANLTEHLLLQLFNVQCYGRYWDRWAKPLCPRNSIQYISLSVSLIFSPSSHPNSHHPLSGHYHLCLSHLNCDLLGLCATSLQMHTARCWDQGTLGLSFKFFLPSHPSLLPCYHHSFLWPSNL